MTEENPNVIDLSSPRGGPASSPESSNQQPAAPPRPEQMSGLPPGWPPNIIPPAMSNHLGNLTGNMDINHLGGSLSHQDPQMMGLLCMPQTANLSGVDPELQNQLFNLEKHYRLQAEVLTTQFDQQRRLLAQEQVKMQEYFKMMMIQKQQQELIRQQQMDDQRRESEQQEMKKLNLIKHKSTEDESAVASSVVKQKLRQCLLDKELAVKNSPPEFRQWATQHSSLEQHSPPTSGLSPPLSRPGHPMSRFTDYPLRKTASEPNLKVRLALKQKMIERRSSPLLRRKDRLSLLAAKRTNTPLNIDTIVCNSNPDSGPSSPQTSSQSSAGETPTQKEEPAAPLRMIANMVINQSMPNISIGQPRDKMPQTDSQQSLSQSASEAELRVRAAAQYGLPLTSYQYYPMPNPPLPEGEMSPTQAAIVEAQLKSLEMARSTGQLPINNTMAPSSIPPTLINTMSLPESSTRIQRPPLHRTHSAPLPLPGQLLWNQHLFLQKQQEQLLKDSQKNYLKQKLQSTLQQRSSSKSQMENVDEAAENRLSATGDEAAAASADNKEIDVVVIDEQKTEKRASPRTSRRDHESFLLKMRQPAISEGSPPMTTTIPEKGSEESSPDMDMAEYGAKSLQNLTERSSCTGISYDALMLRHECICGNKDVHPENPHRLQCILSQLESKGLLQKCEKIKSRKATPEELRTCHSEAYVHMYSSHPHKLDPVVFDTFFPRFCKLPCGGIGVDSDTVWNELYTPQVVRMATGCVIDLAFKVARGDIPNGFALVRPPGHHAEDQQAMGFCFFNSIAVATKLLLDRLQMKKILIVDWDVHHGNSTQQLFYTDPRVLYISLHRHDNGNFFPGTGGPGDCGIEKGVGYNVNVAFAGHLSPPMGDAEYLAAFRTIVMPIAQEYKPELVLVSAGFDAAVGHPGPLGGYQLTPACFGYMTQQLMTLAEGKVALVLEGGYVLEPTCSAVELCLKALLKENIEGISEVELHRKPYDVAVETIQTTIRCQAPYWPCVTGHHKPLGLSHVEALKLDAEDADTVSAFASLSVLAGQNAGHKLNSNEPMADVVKKADHSEQPMEES